ncbi:MAG TPA: hypothetical protein VN040_01970 [Pseudosphingobacterium sp.]|nr:hypothetical protein [Pseudosphingobacterium sp.]
MNKPLQFAISIAPLTFIGTSLFAQEKLPQIGKDSNKDIIKKMTIEEKARVVVGKGASGPSVESNDKTPDRLPAISSQTIPIPRFGMPSISMADGPSRKEVAELYLTAPKALTRHVAIDELKR